MELRKAPNRGMLIVKKLIAAGVWVGEKQYRDDNSETEKRTKPKERTILEDSDCGSLEEEQHGQQQKRNLKDYGILGGCR